MSKTQKVVMKTVDKQLNIESCSLTRDQLIKKLDDSISEVPKEFQDTVVFEVERFKDWCSDDYSADMFMYYKRPENEVERAERIGKELKRTELLERAQREQYEALKKKFES